MMRIFEIVERHRSGHARLLDVTGREDVAPHLNSRQSDAPVPSETGGMADVRPGDVVVALLDDGSPASSTGSLEELEALAGSLPEDSALLVLTTGAVTGLPVGPLVSALTSAGLQVVEASPVSHPTIRAAVLARPAKVPVPFVAYLGSAPVSQPDEAQLRRLISEHLVEGLVARARDQAQESLAARVAELEEQLAAAQSMASREAARYLDLERSRSVAMARALSAARRHPVTGLRQAGRVVRGSDTTPPE
jgi:hypothetical protein